MTSTSQPLRVAIIGGGIGGLTAAHVLLREGHAVTCLEQAAELRELGAGIQLGPNAARVLHHLGLAAALDAVAVRPASLEIRRWRDGRVLKQLPCNPDVALAYGAPYYTLHRADLQALLHAALPPSTVRLGARCVGVVERDRGVAIELAGGERHAFDAVIGADGIRSAIRGLLGPEPPPRFSGKVAYRVLVPASRVPRFVDPPAIRMWLGPGRHLVSYPISRGRHLSLASSFPALDADVESWTREGTPAHALAATAGWHEDIHALFALGVQPLALPLYDRPPGQPGAGRVTLLGDAAHPMLPFFAQGAAQAIEDAWMLGRCLRGATAGSVAEQLRRYERARGPRTAHVQARSARNGKLFQLPDGARQWVRDALLRRLTLASFDWLYGYDVDAALC